MRFISIRILSGSVGGVLHFRPKFVKFVWTWSYILMVECIHIGSKNKFMINTNKEFCNLVIWIVMQLFEEK